MMNIARGQVVEAYARKYGAEVGEVLDWMNRYINQPEEFPGVIDAGLMEGTEMERAESIKSYVKRMAQ